VKAQVFQQHGGAQNAKEVEHTLDQPALAAIPVELRGKLEPAEIFHQILEHRWSLSEAAGRDIGTTAARDDYFVQVLPTVPDDLTIAAPVPQPPAQRQADASPQESPG